MTKPWSIFEKSLHMPQQIPLSLYIHLPWCVHKCPYCDFNSHQVPAVIPETTYIDCLINDLQRDLENYRKQRPLHSIFIGGGTPSLFSAKAVAKLLNAVDHYWGITANTEITMEANPGTAEQQRFIDYHHAGINRLSLGIQSFADNKLRALGRIHNGNEAENAMQIALSAGFNNINLDLMHGLPQQSITQGLDDLQHAIELQPTHISWYQLTIEPNTIFYKKPPHLPHDKLIFSLQQQGEQLLAKNNYQQYEVSAYAQPGQQCEHNLNYWQFGDYLGIGAGAHGKITLTKNNMMRTRKVRQPKSYLQRDNPLIEEKIIDKNSLAFEYMLNALRLNIPVNLDHFSARTDLAAEDIAIPLKRAEEKKLIHINNNIIEKTPLGQRFLNDLLHFFL